MLADEMVMEVADDISTLSPASEFLKRSADSSAKHETGPLAQSCQPVRQRVQRLLQAITEMSDGCIIARRHEKVDYHSD